MKTLTLALMLLAAPAVASAQVAAGAIPNSFERPARPAAAQPRPAAPVMTADEPANAKSEEALRAFIAGARGGTIDYAVMTPDLAAQVRAQSAAVGQVLKDLGDVQTVEWTGQVDGADRFEVAFENAGTEWLIGFTPEGKVAALLFRPRGPATSTRPAA